jgi:hypothetical protein
MNDLTLCKRVIWLLHDVEETALGMSTNLTRKSNHGKSEYALREEVTSVEQLEWVTGSMLIQRVKLRDMI